MSLTDPMICLQCLALADYLNASKFKSYIEQLTVSKLSLETAIPAYCYASKFNSCLLLDSAEQMIRSNFGALADSEDLEWLDKSEIEFFIKSNEEHEEVDLLHTLLKWLEMYPAYTEDLISLIRPALLTPEDLNFSFPDFANRSLMRLAERVKAYHKNLGIQESG